MSKYRKIKICKKLVNISSLNFLCTKNKLLNSKREQKRKQGIKETSIVCEISWGL